MQTRGSETRNSGLNTTDSDSPVTTVASTAIPTPRPRVPGRPGASGRVALEAERQQIVKLKAEGRPGAQIAQMTGVSLRTVNRQLARPESQLDFVKLRDAFRGRLLSRVEKAVEPACDLMDHTLAEKDSKGFDAVTRGLHSMEKVAASVSGENQRIQVEHSGQVNVDHREELRALIGLIVTSAK